MDITPTLVETLGRWIDWGCERTRGGLVAVQQGTGMPWWMTIATCTVGVRLLLLPLRLRTMRNARLLQLSTAYCNRHCAPEFKRLVTKHRDAITDTQIVYKRAVLTEWQRIATTVGASPWKSLSSLAVNIPVLVLFAGTLRMMSGWGDRVGRVDRVERVDQSERVGSVDRVSLFEETLQQGGPAGWSDLTAIEPLAAIPVALINAASIEMARRSSPAVGRFSPAVDKSSAAWRRHLPFLLGHGINLLSLTILSQMPGAVNFYFFTSASYSLVETALLSRQSVFNAHTDRFFTRAMTHRYKFDPLAPHNSLSISTTGQINMRPSH